MLSSLISRREFVVSMLGLTGFSGLHAHARIKSGKPEKYYELGNFGNIRIMHMTDSHAQLLPVYYREPSINIGLYDNWGKLPHIVGNYFLKHYGIKRKTRSAYAFTCTNFVENAYKYNKMGGYAQIKYLVDYLRNNFGRANTLFLDGGDTWQGSAGALYTRGRNMVDAQNLLGVDIMVGHWEFSYLEKEIVKNIKALKAEFLAQNVFVKDEALINGVPAYDDSGHAFKPYTVKTLHGNRVVVIGQAFPYTPIANPQRFIPKLGFRHKGRCPAAIGKQHKKKRKAGCCNTAIA